MNDSIHTRPTNGAPPSAALQARVAIYGSHLSDENPAEEEEAYDENEGFDESPDFSHDFENPSAVSRAPVRGGAGTKESAFAKAFEIMLGGSRRLCKVRINQVGFSAPILDYSLGENALCLILKEEGWDCELPCSEDVMVTLPDGRTHRATYMGGFHQFKSIGIQILWFVIVDADQAAPPGTPVGH